MLCPGPGLWQGEACSGQPVVFALPWASGTLLSCPKCGDILRPTGEVSLWGCCTVGPASGWPRRIPV